ncbi:MAG TPA: lytic transglycosylase domain-containing protein [Candidatus Acidoferrales bacterium]|nr:lytic transglycosylase domain-containing protein [Candidatus Acidoferrales bacterium]
MGVRAKTVLLACAVALIGAAPVHAQSAADAGRSRVESWRMFHAAGELYSLDPDLLAAIATVESGGNSSAVSPKGAQGLMQLMPATADRFRVRDPFDPISNTLGAARYMSFLREFHAAGGGENLSLSEMIAAYNAGEGAVQKYGGIPPYPETQSYVRKVLLTYLFGNSRSELASRLGASPAPPLPAPLRVHGSTQHARVQPALTHEKDPIEALTEIQRLREVEINKQQTASRNGAPDAIH